MVPAHVLWRTIFALSLHHLSQVQAARGCTMLIHTETCCVQFTIPGAKEEVHVLCVRGTWGTKRGMRRWVSAELEPIQSWPTLALKSGAQFPSCGAHRKVVERAKGNVLLNEPITLTQILPPLALYLHLRGRIL